LIVYEFETFEKGRDIEVENDVLNVGEGDAEEVT
jgi:hypothetical protein